MKNKTRSVKVSEVHLERALEARESGIWNCLLQCVLAQALHLKVSSNDHVGFETATINRVRYTLEQPIGRALQKAFIWDVDKCRSMLPVSIKLTPQ